LIFGALGLAYGLKEIRFSMANNTISAPAAPHGESVRRRDFIHIASGAFVATGAAMVVWPLVNQMNPAADTLALSTVEVDLAKLDVGQAMKVKWQGKPVFIRNRTAAEIAEAEKVNVAELRDPQSDEARVNPAHKNFLVMLGVCTHLGCIPSGASAGEVKGDFNGYFCPCHGSHYDTSGRIRKGPAPKNLEVPKVAFKSATLIEIG
jgi:ubiquinol-cytochrome c reductase iron-sulfur subunit